MNTMIGPATMGKAPKSPAIELFHRRPARVTSPINRGTMVSLSINSTLDYKFFTMPNSKLQGEDKYCDLTGFSIYFHSC